MSRCPAVVHVPDGPGFLVCDQRCYLRAQICLLLFFCDLNCGLGVIRALFDCGSSILLAGGVASLVSRVFAFALLRPLALLPTAFRPTIGLNVAAFSAIQALQIALLALCSGSQPGGGRNSQPQALGPLRRSRLAGSQSKMKSSRRIRRMAAAILSRYPHTPIGNRFAHGSQLFSQTSEMLVMGAYIVFFSAFR